ncbi:hypothetical protein Gotur_013694 [Gossypium turneri]
MRNPCGCWTRRSLLTSSLYCGIARIIGATSSFVPVLLFSPFSKKWEKPLRALVSKKRKWWAKLYAFEESLKLVGMMNITKATFETDCATLTNKIKKRKDDITLMGYRINECFRNMDRLYNVDVNWANRTCNKVVDCLSKYVISNESHSFFGVDYPLFIHKHVMDDVIN